MAKKGMKRPEIAKHHPRNAQSPVPELQGKASSGREKANPIIAGTYGANQKVFHERPFPHGAYGVINNDLARDNLENDIPYADLQDL